MGWWWRSDADDEAERFRELFELVLPELIAAKVGAGLPIYATVICQEAREIAQAALRSEQRWLDEREAFHASKRRRSNS